MGRVQVHADGQVITPQTLVRARQCGRAGCAWVSSSEYSTALAAVLRDTDPHAPTLLPQNSSTEAAAVTPRGG